MLFSCLLAADTRCSDMVKAEILGVECSFLVCWLADTRCSDMVKAEP
jgi:hypothetical protein